MTAVARPIKNIPPKPWGLLEGHARWVLAVYWLCLAIGTHWPNLLLLPPNGKPTPLQLILSIDKPLHAIGFSGLMVLLILAGIGGRNKPWPRRCAIALAIGVGYSLVDEFTQSLVPGRSVNTSDVVTNFLAMLTVYLLAILPAKRDPKPVPWRLVLAIGLALPLLVVLTLSPWVMEQFIEFKRSIWGPRMKATHPIDHLAHGVVSLVLSVSVIVIWPMTSRRPRLHGGLAILLLVLAGPGVEVAQHFTGRGVEVADMLAHWIGVLVAMTWWAIRLAKSPTYEDPTDQAATPAPPV